VVEAGPLARFVVRRDTIALQGPLTLADSAAVVLRVLGLDQYGNLTAVPFLRVLEQNAGVVGVVAVEPADTGWMVRVRPQRSGRGAVALVSGSVRGTVDVWVQLARIARWSAAMRTGFTDFDYVYPARQRVRAHGGPTVELFAGRLLPFGVTVGGGATMGIFSADTVPTPSILVSLAQVFVRAEAAPIAVGRVSPVVAVGGGAYRLRGDDKGEYVLHTALFWSVGGGVDIATGSTLVVQLRVAHQHHSDFQWGHVATLRPVHAGVRFTF
jgi:hypothetical protein